MNFEVFQDLRDECGMLRSSSRGSESRFALPKTREWFGSKCCCALLMRDLFFHHQLIRVIDIIQMQTEQEAVAPGFNGARGT